MSINNNIRAIVCPKKKLVRIIAGKKRKAVLLKTYRFKQTVPMVTKKVSVTKYDFGAWSVSEQSWEEEKIIQVYDEKVMEEIRTKALEFYNKQNSQP